jgi:hypothetical protein
MLQMTDERVVFRHVWGYEPVITRKDEQLYYSMPVDSRFVTYSVDVPITDADFAVLVADLDRYLLLYAILYQPCQLQTTMPDDAQFRLHLDMVLHRPLRETERYAASFSYVAYARQQFQAAHALMVAQAESASNLPSSG